MTTPATILQAAAIPMREAEICLITSRSGKRWVIPKGHLEPGKALGEIALLEAWEEAGLVGIMHPHPVGTYLYEKYGNIYHVTVFLMDITEVAEDWPERTLRQRCWFQPMEVLTQITDDGLRRILRRVFAERGLAGALR
jgi:8-oxo-dGTP pyrophosphatase MutT (NUDIX family)